MTSADVTQWYPKGGFYQVPASLKRIAEKNGASFHFKSNVQSVLYDANNKATGILMANGEKKTADVVIVNADLTWSYNNLFVKEGGLAPTLESQVNGVPVGEATAHVKGYVGTGEERLLEPKKARKLLEKPHSYVVSQPSAECPIFESKQAGSHEHKLIS